MIILQDAPGLSRALADFVLNTALHCVALKDRFYVALSGGSTPRAAHRLLAKEPISSSFPWKHTCVFWVDERCVGPDDPASNYGNACRDLLDKVPIPRNNIFAMPAERPPDSGSLEYERLLARTFDLSPGSLPRFDLILLGLGNDGHTASLFPGDHALGETERMVVPVRGGVPRVDRLTLTLPVLNAAAHKVFGVSGRAKANTVRAVLENKDTRLPASHVSGPRTWLIDAEAASRLTETSRGNCIKMEDGH